MEAGVVFVSTHGAYRTQYNMCQDNMCLTEPTMKSRLLLLCVINRLANLTLIAHQCSLSLVVDALSLVIMMCYIKPVSGYIGVEVCNQVCMCEMLA